MSQPTPPSASGYADSTRPYLAALRRHVRLVVGLPLALAVVGLAIRQFWPRKYIARAAFVASEPMSASSTLGALSSISAQFGIPALGALASGSAAASPQFYAALLTSNQLLHAVVTTRYDAREVAENGGRPFEGTLVDYLDPRGVTPLDREVEAMKQLTRKVMEVTIDRPAGIVRIEVRTKNRQLSAAVVRRLLDLVNDFNLLRRQSQAGAERDFDAARSAAGRDTLRAAEEALAAFRAANIDFSHSPLLATREAELQRRVTLAQQIYTTIAQKYELASIEAVRNTPVVTVVDAPEGLVEAAPRYRVVAALAGFLVGLVIACVVAIRSERLALPT